MNAPNRALLTSALVLAAAASPLPGQVLHVNDRWKNCAIVIDPSLTQAAFHQFVSEVALVTYFRPLSSASPLGKHHIEFALLQQSTRIDAADDAWNDTFSHPDSTHWLFDGGALPIPGLTLRAGITDRMDLGAYFTKSIGANYAMAGGQLQYSLLESANRNLAAAARVSFVRLFGPEDLGASVYGVDLLMSRKLSVLSPYAGISGYLSRGQEHTPKVDLQTENVFGVQGTAGVAVSLKGFRLGTELNLARVRGYAFKVGYGL